jgi:hypothetical protein
MQAVFMEVGSVIASGVAPTREGQRKAVIFLVHDDNLGGGVVGFGCLDRRGGFRQSERLRYEHGAQIVPPDQIVGDIDFAVAVAIRGKLRRRTIA